MAVRGERGNTLEVRLRLSYCRSCVTWANTEARNMGRILSFRSLLVEL